MLKYYLLIFKKRKEVLSQTQQQLTNHHMRPTTTTRTKSHNFELLVLTSEILFKTYLPNFLLKPQSVQLSHSVMSDSLRPQGLQYARLPVHHQLPELAQTHVHRVGDAFQPSHPLPSVLLLLPIQSPSSCLQSFPASVSFQMTQYFASGSQSNGVNIQDWFPLGLTGLITLQPKGLSRVFSNTTV